MDARSLVAMVAILFLLWLVRAWANSDSHAKKADESRQRLRRRLEDASLGERVGISTSIGTRAVDPDVAHTEHGSSAGAQLDIALTEPGAATVTPSGSSHDASENQMAHELRTHHNTTEATANKELERLQSRLEQAEARAKASEQNDIELRRLRSELVSLRSEKSNAAIRIAGLEKRIVEQQRVLEQAQHANGSNNDIVKLQQEVAERAQQNAELRARLSAMSQAREADTVSGSSHHGANAGGANSEDIELTKPQGTTGIAPDAQMQQKSSSTVKIIKPLFEAPSQRDDLKLIKGIGPVMERTLNQLGVTTFSQLAGFSQADIDKVSEAIGAFPGRIERDDWVGKAMQFVRDKSTV